MVKSEVSIISYSRAGIYEDGMEFGAFSHVYRVEYTRCRYSEQRAVSRARWRLREAGEEHHHTLYNNSHFFVTWAKTGSEFMLYDIVNGITCEEEGTVCMSCTYIVKYTSDVIQSSQDMQPVPSICQSGNKSCQALVSWQNFSTFRDLSFKCKRFIH